MSGPKRRVGLLATHPIQYYAPWYRALAREVDLEVFFSHRQTPEGQAAAGFGVPFDWDVPLVDGYRSTFLRNTAPRPSVDRFLGCRTPEIAGIVRARAFDAFIVHGWGTWSYWQAIRACWRTGTPVLVRGDSVLSTPRAWWRRGLKEPLYRWFVPKFDGYLVVGARAKEYLLHYGASPERCTAAPHAVDNDWFASHVGAERRNRAALRRSFGLPEDAVVFLFAGKFVGLKRPDLFVDALAIAAHDQSAVAALMAGDGPLREAAEARARRLGARVAFTGFLNQTAMARAYAASDVLVLPSDHETWGLVVNEAMASGLPAIASDRVGCVGDLVEPGVTGEVFAAGDAGDLARAMGRLAPADARARAARGARDRVQRFSLEAAVSGVVEAVDRLAGAREHSRRPLAGAPELHA